MSELAQKLARRRQLNGESGESVPPAVSTTAYTNNADNSKTTIDNSSTASSNKLEVGSAPIKAETPSPVPTLPERVTTATAKPQNVFSKEGTSDSPPRPPKEEVDTNPINIFSLASKENKTVISHIKNEPVSVPARPLSMQRRLHTPSHAQPPVVASDIPPSAPVVAEVLPDRELVANQSVLPPNVPKQASDPPAAPALPADQHTANTSSSTTDADDLDDLAGLEGFLDSLDDAPVVKKLEKQQSLVRRGSNQPTTDMGSVSGQNSLFADDDDLDAGISRISSDPKFVLTTSPKQSLERSALDEEDEEDLLRGESVSARTGKRRSRFGSHDLLSEYGFGAQEVCLFFLFPPSFFVIS